MGIFSDVRLQWGEEEYKIPAGSVLRAIAVVEEIITLGEMPRPGRPRIPLARLSMAYAALLRFAGAKVSDDEVYNAMFGKAGGSLAARVSEAVFALECLMIPPEHLRAAAEGAGGKAEETSRRRAGSSKRPTSSSSARGG